jgi:hypothetical protein
MPCRGGLCNQPRKDNVAYTANQFVDSWCPWRESCRRTDGARDAMTRAGHSGDGRKNRNESVCAFFMESDSQVVN